MSSHRLKRKLGDLGVDVAGSRANENFVLIGTPLPALEKAKDLNEFVPLWKQEVRDEKGRRRLHGAFTGGFSAGYFNTVGSKEGWAPSTFVSSRGDRAKKPQQGRAEDFMDEEDLQDVKDSLKLVDNADEMDLSQAGPSSTSIDDSDPLVQKLQNTILPSPSDSTGARILKKMGWKLGQGIGPRISLRHRRLQDLQAATGGVLSLDDIKLSEEDAEADKHKYAPRDTSLLVVGRKDNSHGLGYHPGMGLNETLGRQGAQSQGPNLSSGFGLGALNEADEDDLDVYDSAMGPGRSRIAYDIAEKDDDSNRFSSSAKRMQKPSSYETFNDGRQVLSGFSLSKSPVSEDRWYPPPTVPQGWISDPRRVTQSSSTDKENDPHQGPVSHAEWKTGISADQRGAILGETPLPAAPRSVFDFMSQKNRDRLQNFATSRDQPKNDQATHEPGPPTSSKKEIHIPRTEPHIADAALKGFQPYISDPPKQARYKAYLNCQVDPSQFKPPAPLPHQSIDEFNKELSDYVQSAQIFKPMSGAMAGRFRSAKVIEKGSDLKEGLHTPATDGDLPGSEAEQEPDAGPKEEEELDPKVNAAKLGMYGPLTREIIPWIPDRLLCKRFGVKEPEVLASEEAEAESMSGPAAAAEAQQKQEEELAKAEENVALLDGPIGPRDLSNIGLGEDEYQGRDTLTYTRPSMDIFKAIFADDEDDSDEDEGGEKKDDPDGDVTMVDLEPPVDEIPPPPPPLPLPQPPPPTTQREEIDMNTFKPTFVPRDRKTKEVATAMKKGKKKEKKPSTLVSFNVDEGEEELGLTISPERPKKKKKRKKEKVETKEDEDDSMWVEKPPPEALEDGQGMNARRGRAVDFM